MARRAWLKALSIVLFLAVVVPAGPAFPQTATSRTEPDVPEKKGKELRAFAVGDKAPRIDGRLDDEIWGTADRVEDLVQNDPDNMAAPTERTVIQVAYDDRSIYVAVRCYMADVSKITTALGRRDTNPRSDMIRISFEVEQDPAVLNLSVFETFFPEKRPFFIEDSRTLVPPYFIMPTFHSRRIGQRPGRLALKAGDTLIEQPDQTTILGATKVTGKASGWTYGGLTALTDREYATVDATTIDGAGREQVFRTGRLIEPYTSFNVGRVQRDIFMVKLNYWLGL